MQDVCSMPKDYGPCVGRFKKWSYQRSRRACEPFTFGGCEGNGNRFSSAGECQTVCLVQEEPGLSGNNTATAKRTICHQPADAGACADALKRWHYAPDRGNCVPFIFTGCSGNRYVNTLLLRNIYEVHFRLGAADSNY